MNDIMLQILMLVMAFVMLIMCIQLVSLRTKNAKDHGNYMFAIAIMVSCIMDLSSIVDSRIQVRDAKTGKYVSKKKK